MKRFGVMLDMSRNAVMKPSEIKKYAKLHKVLGFNGVQSYTEDTYEVDSESYFGYMRGRYTQEELKEIANYCENIGIEIIPCIQVPAHLKTIFRWNPYEKINDTNNMRFGELKQRLQSCKRRLIEYVEERVESIPELEEKLLDFYRNGEEHKKRIPCFNGWASNVTVNVLSHGL